MKNKNNPSVAVATAPFAGGAWWGMAKTGGAAVDVGKRLKQIRKSKNISVYKLSQISQVSESHIRNLEKGTKSVTVDTLEMLVNGMNTTMSEFFNEDNSIAYLNQDERALLRYYRTLTVNTSKAVVEFLEKLNG